MAKFTGLSQTFSIGGNAITCIQSVESTENVDIAMVDCAGATYKEKVYGLADAKMTVNFALETDDVTVLGYVDPGDSGAIIWLPAGSTTGDIKLTSTNGTVAGRTISVPVNGFAACTVNVELDDFTVGANS